MHLVDKAVATVEQRVLASAGLDESGTVSFQTQLPQPLQQAMVGFVERCPNWDQYRLVQSAIAGFLFQQGCKDRAVVQHYLSGLFQRDAGSHRVEPSC